MSKEKLLGQDTTGLDRIPEAEMLNIPKLSGAEVTVQLSELDAMRSAHANAIRVAQDLESNKMKVELTLKEETYRAEYDKYGRFTHNSREYTIIGVRHVNLNETIDVLTKQANANVEHLYTSQIKTLENDLEKRSDKLTEISEKRDQANSKVKELETDLAEKTQDLATLHHENAELFKQVAMLTELAESKYKPLLTFNEDLQERYEELRQKKTFWGWVHKQLADEKTDTSKKTDSDRA